MNIFLIFSVLITLSLAIDGNVIFQTIVYPVSETSTNSMGHIYNDLGLTAQITIFTDGTIITTGNSNYLLAPLDDTKNRVMYRGTLTNELLTQFINFIHEDGFLDLPDHHKTEIKYNLICDSYTSQEIQHEVCRTEDSTHDVISQLESQIEQLVLSAQGTFSIYEPEVVFVQKVTVDARTCGTLEYTSVDDIEMKYGSSYDRFVTGERVHSFWDNANRRACIVAGDLTFGFVVIAQDISVHVVSGFDDVNQDSIYNGGSDFSFDVFGTNTDDNYDDGNYYSWNPTFVIILVAFSVFILLLTGAVVRAKRQRRMNASVQNVEISDFTQTGNQMTPVQMQTIQQPAYYVTQTANGPVYYQTNPNPIPQGVVYTVNQ